MLHLATKVANVKAAIAFGAEDEKRHGPLPKTLDVGDPVAKCEDDQRESAGENYVGADKCQRFLLIGKNPWSERPMIIVTAPMAGIPTNFTMWSARASQPLADKHSRERGGDCRELC